MPSLFARPKLWHLPVRLATGAFILNSGLSKRGAPAEAATAMHGMATTAVPAISKVPPQRFVSALSAGEIALGSALLVPLVSQGWAGAGLVGFASGLLRMYMKTPGMREEGSVRPTRDGTALAKDVWLLGIGLSLLLDAMGEGRRRRKTA